MGPDLVRAEARARRAYEVARIWRATIAALPFVFVVLLALVLGARWTSTLVTGAGLYLVGVLLLWRGRELGAGVLPGAAAGLIPLSLAFCAKSYGHVCTDGACVSLCIPACALGGLLAGTFLAFAARRHSARTPFLFAASSVAVLTGSLGCYCLGMGGVVGLLAGLLLPLSAQLLRATMKAAP